MTEKKINTTIDKIEKFIGLTNWTITYEIKDLNSIDDKIIDAQCTSILYSYFSCHIQFDKTMVLKASQDYIEHVIFHELAHIYTTNSMKAYEENKDILIDMSGRVIFDQIKRQMIIVNEQQTEFLARRFHELYKQKNKGC